MYDNFQWHEPIPGQTQTKRQHFVPRLYLKPFTRNDDKVRVVDLQEEREYVSSLNNVAVQSRFYDVKQYGEDYSAEYWLQELEGKAASVLRVLLDDPLAITALTDEQENALARFVAAQIFRTPFRRKEIDDMLDPALLQIEQIAQGMFVNNLGETEGLASFKEWQARPLHERFGEEEPEQPASMTNYLLGEVQGFANLLRAAPWRIGRALNSRLLYTSDNPVSRYLRPVRPWWETRAFSSFDYFLPMSPEILLKIERRTDLANSDRKASPWGVRRRKDFSGWEISVACHVISRDASRFLYGGRLVVSKQCAVSCLDRIELNAREIATRYLGYDPNPPPGFGFPVL